MRPPPGPLASPRAERVVGGLRSGARVGRYLPRDRRCARRGCAEGGERTPGCLRPTGSLRTALPRRRQQRRSAGADPPSSFLSVARPGEMSAFPWAVSWGGRSILMIPRHKSAAFSTPAPAARSFRPTRRVSAAMEASPGSPALRGGGIMVDTGEWGAPTGSLLLPPPPGEQALGLTDEREPAPLTAQVSGLPPGGRGPQGGQPRSHRRVRPGLWPRPSLRHSDGGHAGVLTPCRLPDGRTPAGGAGRRARWRVSPGRTPRDAG